MNISEIQIPRIPEQATVAKPEAILPPAVVSASLEQGVTRACQKALQEILKTWDGTKAKENDFFRAQKLLGKACGFLDSLPFEVESRLAALRDHRPAQQPETSKLYTAILESTVLRISKGSDPEVALRCAIRECILPYLTSAGGEKTPPVEATKLRMAVRNEMSGLLQHFRQSLTPAAFELHYNAIISVTVGLIADNCDPGYAVREVVYNRLAFLRPYKRDLPPPTYSCREERIQANFPRHGYAPNRSEARFKVRYFS